MAVLTILGLQNEVTVPEDVRTLADFQTWVRSPEFPQTGRIDFVRGRIEIDMNASRIDRHDFVISELARVLGTLAKDSQSGFIAGENVRMVAPAAQLSCQPDLKYVSWESIRTGRVVRRLAPDPVDAMDFWELEGAVDLVVEVVSPGSRAKDLNRLPPAYFDAGVAELWRVDATGPALKFLIHRRGGEGFERVPADVEGFVPSAVFGRTFRLTARPGPEGSIEYLLEHRALLP